MSDKTKKNEAGPRTSPNLSNDVIKSTGLINLTEKQQKKAIYVTNISSKATIKHISEFFSYCGAVEKVVQDYDPTSPDPQNPKQFAVVIFEEDQAFATALLLGSSEIEDSKINVHPYSSIVLNSLKEKNHLDEDTNLTNGQRSSSSVVTTLIALGYIQGENLMTEVKNKAQQMDESMNLSEKVSSAFHYSVESCKQFDESYKFSETLSGLGNQAMETTQNVYKNIDETLGLGDKAKSVKDYTTNTATNISNTAMEYEPVKTSVDFFSNLTNNTVSFLKDGWSFWANETSSEIQRQHQSNPNSNQNQNQSSNQQQPRIKEENQENQEESSKLIQEE
eukprot:gene1392-12012_t